MATIKSRTKVVVRRLPPALTEEGFRQAAGKLLEDLQHDWFAYYPGKISQKRVVFSRAYINFSQPESVLEFKHAFDGHLFVGAKGSQYRCSVEYAPYQKTPAATTKKDARDGTILKDPDYLEFLQLLEQGPEALPSASAQLEAQERAQSQQGADGTTRVTPLMEYLMEKYAANPNMKLGSLRRGKRKEGAAAAAAAAGAEAGQKTIFRGRARADEPDTHAGANPRSTGRDRPAAANGGASASSAVASPAPRSGRPGKPAGLAPAPASAAPVVLLIKPKPGSAGRDQRNAPSTATGIAAGAGAGAVPKDSAGVGAGQHAVGKGVGRHQERDAGRAAQAAATKVLSGAGGATQDGVGPGRPGRGEQPRPQSGRPAATRASQQPEANAGPAAPAASTGPVRSGGAGRPSARAGAGPPEAPASAPAPAPAPKAGADPGAAAAAAAAAALQRIPMPSASGASRDADGSGGGAEEGGAAGQRARKVRAGFQAYVPGALRSGRTQPPQGDSG